MSDCLRYRVLVVADGLLCRPVVQLLAQEVADDLEQGIVCGCRRCSARWSGDRLRLRCGVGGKRVCVALRLALHALFRRAFVWHAPRRVSGEPRLLTSGLCECQAAPGITAAAAIPEAAKR